MKTMARAFWITGPGQGEVREERLPDLGPSELMLECLTSGISRGSEALVFQGRVPPSQYQSMRAPFQSGTFPAPVKYGYSNVARVLQGPDSWLGQRVFCLFPHQDFYIAPERAVLPLPSEIPSSRAALAANMETALNAVWDAAPRRRSHIAVIGAGVTGCLSAWLLKKLAGADVMLIDKDQSKRTIAEALSLQFQTPGMAAEAYDLIVHASGAPAGLELALHLARFEGRILDLSWYGDQGVTLSLGENFHAKRLTLQSSQVGAVATSRRADWSRRRRLAKAIALLDDPALDCLLTGASPLEHLADTMATLAQSSDGVLCHRVSYGGAAAGG